MSASNNHSNLASDLTNYYLTSDTAIASWLHSQGFILSTVLTSKTPYIFVFEKSPELLSAVSSWQRGQADGNCFTFENSRKQLMKIIKSQLNSSRIDDGG